MSSTIQPTILRAKVADADGVHKVMNGVVADGGGPRNGIDSMVTPDSVAQWIRDLGDRGALFLARSGEQAAAACALEPIDAEAARLRVWVLPAFRRQGLGGALGRVANQFARERGYKRVVGHVPAENEAALSFFSAVAGEEALQPGLKFELPLE